MPTLTVVLAILQILTVVISSKSAPIGITSEAVPLVISNHLSIPSINVSAPLFYAESLDENLFQELLQKGVVHYPHTAKPGQVGNAYFFGHSSDYWWTKGDYKNVFKDLPQLINGAEIVVYDHTGNNFVYHVIDTKVVNPTDVSVLTQDSQGRYLLSLQTSYPIGSASRRFVVLAEMKK